MKAAATRIPTMAKVICLWVTTAFDADEAGSDPVEGPVSWSESAELEPEGTPFEVEYEGTSGNNSSRHSAGMVAT